MQPVNSNPAQHQVITSQQNIAVHNETSRYTTRIPLSGDKFILPKDVVNLSFDRSSIPDSSGNKHPSKPVTSIEKKALQDSFSVYA